MAFRLNSILQSPKRIILVSAVLLLVIVFFTSWFANLLNLTNADHLIYPYLFQDFNPHQIVAPMQHSNLLKYPLFILQSALPYNNFTISIFNIGTVVITVMSWYFLVLYTFKWRFAFPLMVIFSSIFLGSIVSNQLFNHEILGSTIRNIEFPIAFAFIIIISKILINGLPKNVRARILITVSSLLYAVTLAGDGFFLYVVSAPVILVLIGHALTAKKLLTKRILVALGLVIFTSLIGLLIRKVIDAVGIVVLFNDPLFSLKTVPFDNIAPSISVATQQLLNLFGANIFGRTIGLSILLPLMNTGILILSIIGIMAIVTDSLKGQLSKKEANSFVLLCLSLISVMTFVVYILSDLVVKIGANNEAVSAEQDRYLTIVIFISIIGVTYALKKMASRRFVTAIVLAICLVLIVSLPSIFSNLRSEYRTFVEPMNNSLTQIAKNLKENNVSFVLSGYWYASPTKLFSNNTIDFAPIGHCNLKEPVYNINKQWYIPSNNTDIHTALLIDRAGPDKIYWPCTDEQLASIYGKPEKIIDINDGISLHLYNYDIRSKVR